MSNINLRAILSGSLGAFGCGLLLCRIMGYEPEGSIMLFLSGLGAAWAGNWSLTKRWHLAATGGILLLGAAIFCGIFHRNWGMGFMAGAAGGLCLMAVRFCGFGYRGTLGAWSLVLSVFGLICAGKYGVLWQSLALGNALAALLCYLEGSRYSSLRRGHFMGDTVPGFGRPQTLSVANFVLFLAVALPLGVLGWGLWIIVGDAVTAALADGTRNAVWGIRWLLDAIERFYVFVLQFFQPEPPVDRSPSGSDQRDVGFSNAAVGVISTLGTVALLVAAASILAGVGIAVVRKGFKPGLKKQVTQDYEETVENLKRPKNNLLKKLMDRMKKQKISDFSDPALKIRFAFQQLLIKKQKEQACVFHKTPNELLNPDVPGEEALVHAYNRVRYANGMPTKAEIAAAEQYVKNKYRG